MYKYLYLMRFVGDILNKVCVFSIILFYILHMADITLKKLAITFQKLIFLTK